MAEDEEQAPAWGSPPQQYPLLTVEAPQVQVLATAPWGQVVVQAPAWGSPLQQYPLLTVEAPQVQALATAPWPQVGVSEWVLLEAEPHPVSRVKPTPAIAARCLRCIVPP
jgi:hypothetical protein